MNRIKPDFLSFWSRLSNYMCKKKKHLYVLYFVQPGAELSRTMSKDFVEILLFKKFKFDMVEEDSLHSLHFLDPIKTPWRTFDRYLSCSWVDPNLVNCLIVKKGSFSFLKKSENFRFNFVILLDNLTEFLSNFCWPTKLIRCRKFVKIPFTISSFC